MNSATRASLVLLASLALASVSSVSHAAPPSDTEWDQTLAKLLSNDWATREAAQVQLERWVSDVPNRPEPSKIQRLRSAMGADADLEQSMRATAVFQVFALTVPEVSNVIERVEVKHLEFTVLPAPVRRRFTLNGYFGTTAPLNADFNKLLQKYKDVVNEGARTRDGMPDNFVASFQAYENFVVDLSAGQFAAFKLEDLLGDPITKDQLLDTIRRAKADAQRAFNILQGFGGDPPAMRPPLPTAQQGLGVRPDLGKTFAMEFSNVLAAGEIDIFMERAHDCTFRVPDGLNVVDSIYSLYEEAGLALDGRVDVSILFGEDALPSGFDGDLDAIVLARFSNGEYTPLDGVRLEPVDGQAGVYNITGFYMAESAGIGLTQLGGFAVLAVPSPGPFAVLGVGFALVARRRRARPV